MDHKDIVASYEGWVVTLNTKNKRSHIELRKKFRFGDLFILVSDGNGYDYKHYQSEPDRWGRSTKGINIHMSTNGPIQMTFDEFIELTNVVDRAESYFISKRQ